MYIQLLITYSICHPERSEGSRIHIPFPSLERGLGVCYFTYYGTFKQYSIMETKNGKRVLLSDDELKEVSGGWIIFAIPCKDYKEKEKCEEKGCVWTESGKCKNK